MLENVSLVLISIRDTSFKTWQFRYLCFFVYHITILTVIPNSKNDLE